MTKEKISDLSQLTVAELEEKAETFYREKEWRNLSACVERIEEREKETEEREESEEIMEQPAECLSPSAKRCCGGWGGKTIKRLTSRSTQATV